MLMERLWRLLEGLFLLLQFAGRLAYDYEVWVFSDIIVARDCALKLVFNMFYDFRWA